MGRLDNRQPNVNNDNYSSPLARSGTEVQPAVWISEAYANLMRAFNCGFDTATFRRHLRVTPYDMPEPSPVAQRDLSAQRISQLTIDHPAACFSPRGGPTTALQYAVANPSA